jgi:hypothetical protein
MRADFSRLRATGDGRERRARADFSHFGRRARADFSRFRATGESDGRERILVTTGEFPLKSHASVVLKAIKV